MPRSLCRLKSLWRWPLSALLVLALTACEVGSPPAKTVTGKTVPFIAHSIDEALILSNRSVVMSARTGRVKATYQNDLPRPRSMDVQITDRFIELKREVWDLVGRGDGLDDSLAVRGRLCQSPMRECRVRLKLIGYTAMVR